MYFPKRCADNGENTAIKKGVLSTLLFSLSDHLTSAGQTASVYVHVSSLTAFDF